MQIWSNDNKHLKYVENFFLAYYAIHFYKYSMYTLKMYILGTSLAVQWLQLHTFTAGRAVPSLIGEPRSFMLVPHAVWNSQKYNNNFCNVCSLILRCRVL